jgi:hypothetical protein
VIAVVADATEGKQNVKATVKSGMKDLLGELTLDPSLDKWIANASFTMFLQYSRPLVRALRTSTKTSLRHWEVSAIGTCSDNIGVNKGTYRFPASVSQRLPTDYSRPRSPSTTPYPFPRRSL